MTCDCPTCQVQAADADAAHARADKAQAFLKGWTAWRFARDRWSRKDAARDAQWALKARLAARKVARA